MRRRLVVGLIALVALSAPGIVLEGQQPGVPGRGPGGAGAQVFLVQMADAPVVAYTGGIPGYTATRPVKGQKINPLAPAVVRYAGLLTARHDEALARAGGGRKLYSYRYTFNGFAAELSAAQAAVLERVPGVLAVTRDELVEMDTATTPGFIGLEGDGGLWEQLGGADRAGEGIIIGVVDSGIWPESASFSDRTGANGSTSKGGKLSYRQVPGWHGRCVPGEQFTGANCNQKLIGATYFNAAWGGDAGIDALRPWEFNSPRDYNGHGTHTSSTAGGNHGVTPTGFPPVFGTVSGIAPRARVAMYKALWSLEDASQAQGFTSDLVAAIDQAVADGVDVINYSVSGSRTSFIDAVGVAFLYAADAGVFVATSAGNSGPATGTVAHPGPWVTTVAAGTHDRYAEATVTLGNDATYTGASLATAVSGPFIDSITAGLPGADATAVALCYAAVDNGGVPVLDPAIVAGKIVLCDRGVTARVNKSLAVMEAGGIGMILVNTAVSSLNADLHYVPSVHLAHTDRAAVKAYAAT
ncbi:MAG TPA: S8 family serine peptidase, partial [Vicinamibacterales bacterium]|nr:S8 family serine peptidase [Vicinamibacterales bacterium]